MNAISFDFVATAILISMFLVMAIFEHLFRPNASFSSHQDAANRHSDSRPMQKLAHPHMVIRESSTSNQAGDRPFYDYLEGCLRHKAEMVIFEATRAIIELSGVISRELTPAITVLQLFLSSSKPVLQFAAVRTLNKVAMTHPLGVTNCNIDMESSISDQNRSTRKSLLTQL